MALISDSTPEQNGIPRNGHGVEASRTGVLGS